MRDKTWDTIRGYFICLNLDTIVATILKLFGVIGDDIPWLVVVSPMIFAWFTCAFFFWRIHE